MVTLAKEVINKFHPSQLTLSAITHNGTVTLTNIVNEQIWIDFITTYSDVQCAWAVELNLGGTIKRFRHDAHDTRQIKIHRILNLGDWIRIYYWNTSFLAFENAMFDLMIWVEDVA
jgi:hypothetical protein